MKRRLSDYRVFLREFFSNYHTTGAVLPSGRRLSRALARFVGTRDGTTGPRRILEVGPGTGAVTREIAAVLGPEDQLDLVELNDSFVEHLRQCLAEEPNLTPIANRTQVLHCAVQDLPVESPYDLIVSGLPLNNFAAEQVEQILSALRRLLKPGGTLSFFQYIAIRYARALVSGRAERERLRGVARALDGVLVGNEIHRDWIWPNVPPAWVHHVRFA